MKFTPAGGAVSIEAAVRAVAPQVPDVIFVRITDTGVGIAKDKLSSVFEPFVQVSATNVTRREGTGLGLSISRDLARGMHGDLRARSTPGTGSSFTVTLPVAWDDSGELHDRRTLNERRDGEQRSREDRRHEIGGDG
jgi:signal transduction histidine kinase